MNYNKNKKEDFNFMKRKSKKKMISLKVQYIIHYYYCPNITVLGPYK